jgi:hypothetical protein
MNEDWDEYPYDEVNWWELLGGRKGKRPPFKQADTENRTRSHNFEVAETDNAKRLEYGRVTPSFRYIRSPGDVADICTVGGSAFTLTDAGVFKRDGVVLAAFPDISGRDRDRNKVYMRYASFEKLGDKLLTTAAYDRLKGKGRHDIGDGRTYVFPDNRDNFCKLASKPYLRSQRASMIVASYDPSNGQCVALLNDSYQLVALYDAKTSRFTTYFHEYRILSELNGDVALAFNPCAICDMAVGIHMKGTREEPYFRPAHNTSWIPNHYTTFSKLRIDLNAATHTLSISRLSIFYRKGGQARPEWCPNLLNRQLECRAHYR